MSDLLRNGKKRLKKILSAASNGLTGRQAEIPLHKILMGGEGEMRALAYATLTNDPMRPSTPVAESPHSCFLREFQKEGSALLEEERFSRTTYFKNARDCIRIFGDYYPYIHEPKAIKLAALRFVRQLAREDCSDLPGEGHSPAGEPIRVYTITDSDCFELAEGNHRCAFAVVAGQKTIRARIIDRPNPTPMQQSLRRVLWDSGQNELYQPLPLPEISSRWTLIRQCSDRFERMKAFLAQRGLNPAKTVRVLDIGAYYGWFVSEFTKLGYDGIGVERDQTAIRIGELVYKNTHRRMVWDDATVFLDERKEQFDVISCLSVMHHFVLGKTRIDAEAFLKLLDASTRKVLFLEMGEEHEEWFRKSLRGWNAKRIRQWMLENSSFSEAIELGRDSDHRLKHAGNFQRMLFAFVKRGS